MTTEVKIKPAGHRLRVELAEGPADDRTVTATEVQPGPVEVTYWLYGDRSITISEISISG